MTAFLTFCLGLLAGASLILVKEQRRLRRVLSVFAARLDRQSQLLARLAVNYSASETAARSEAALSAPEQVEPEQVETVEPGGETAERPGDRQRGLAAALKAPWSASPPPAWRGFLAALKTAAPPAALLAALGFLAGYALTLRSFPPALRLGAVFLGGLILSALGALAPARLRKLGLCAAGGGLGLMALGLAGAAGPGLLSLGTVRAGLSGLLLFGLGLSLKRRSLFLSALIPAAFLGLWVVLEPSWPALAKGAAGLGLSLASLRLVFGRLAAGPGPRLWGWLALVCFNLALFGLIQAEPPTVCSAWTALSAFWALEAAVLRRLTGRPAGRLAGDLALASAVLAALFIPDRFAGAPVTQFFLASLILGAGFLDAAIEGATPGRPIFLAGPLCWLAGSLVSAGGLAAAGWPATHILNWLLAVWSVMALALGVIFARFPGLAPGPADGGAEPGAAEKFPVWLWPLVLPLAPASALVLGFWGGFLEGDFSGSAWALWGLAQIQGLALARRRGAATVWGEVSLVVLALALGRLTDSLWGGTDFGAEFSLLAGIFLILALLSGLAPSLARPLAGLGQAAGTALSALSLWRGLAWLGNPGDQPGFFGFLPIFNLVDLTQAGALLLPALFFSRRVFKARNRAAANFGLGLGFFIWFNAALARAVHHLADIPYAFEMFLAAPFQGVCLAAWAAVGLAAGRRRYRLGRL